MPFSIAMAATDTRDSKLRAAMARLTPRCALGADAAPLGLVCP